jgi:hypothetical protein
LAVTTCERISSDPTSPSYSKWHGVTWDQNTGQQLVDIMANLGSDPSLDFHTDCAFCVRRRIKMCKEDYSCY